VRLLPSRLGTPLLALMLLLPQGALPWDTLFEGEHICICPIDSDGHCECAECNRLGIHGDTASHEDRRGDRQPCSVKRSCGDGPSWHALGSPESFVAASDGPGIGSPPFQIFIASARRDELRAPDPDRLERPPRNA